MKDVRAENLPKPKTLAIIAHDGKKVDVVSWAAENRSYLQGFRLIATATTGKLLKEKVGLKVETLLSGPEGGDVQIASRITLGEVDAVFFFIDPLNAHPHDPDIRAVMRVCNVHNVPIAMNLATADLLIGATRFQALPHEKRRTALSALRTGNGFMKAILEE